MRYIGVITGDIVNSTKIPLENRGRLIDSLKKITGKIGTCHLINTDFFRGDSVQIVVEHPADTMAVAILMRAGIMAETPHDRKPLWDIRISASIGTWEMDGFDFSMSDGEAFRLSGRALDAMKKKRLVFSSTWDEMNAEMKVSTAFLDNVISKWTKTQARIVFERLMEPGKQAQLASMLEKSNQSISNSLYAAGYNLIELYLSRFSLLTNKTYDK